MTNKKNILVVGGTGTIGSAVLRSLIKSNTNDQIIATTRRATNPFPAGVQSLQVDLLTDPDHIRTSLASLPPITHLIYAGLFVDPAQESPQSYRTMRRLVKGTGWVYSNFGWIPNLRTTIEQTIAHSTFATTKGKENEKMLDNILTALEQPPHQLQHVGLITGGKFYGMHLSPYIHLDWRTTMREDDPPAPEPNFYYFQEARVQTGAQQHGYAFTISRPPYIVGYSDSVGFNLLKSIAIYATLLKEQGLPLIFPGDTAAADAIYAWCDVDLVGHLHAWALDTPTAHNNIFNISNGNPSSLRQVWPDIAAALDMEASFDTPPPPSRQVFKNGRTQWPQIVAKYNLRDIPFEQLTKGDSLNLMCTTDWDTHYDLSRLRQAGFTQQADSGAVFRKWIAKLRQDRIIP